MAASTNGQQVNQDPLLRIRMLGDFSVTYQGKNLLDGLSRSQQVWTLFQYIITFRNKRIPADDFYDVLWEDGECINPAKALQNLVYRLRNVLQVAVGGSRESFIVFSHGCYSWNQSLPYELDVEEFEKLAQIAIGYDADSMPNAQEYYERALNLYVGDYLAELPYVEWLFPVRSQYKRLYLECVRRLVRILRREQNYQRILEILEHATAIEPYEEGLHADYIDALLKINRVSRALQYYEYITGKLYSELGIKPSAELRQVYRSIHDYGEDVQLDLDSIQRSLSEDGPVSSAFYCDLDTFRVLYKAEARKMTRSGSTAFVGLITLVDESFNAISNQGILQAAMDTMRQALISSLRIGDIVAKWNDIQYIMMLHSLSYEDGDIIIRRIESNFWKHYSGQKIQVRFKIQPITSDYLQSKMYAI